MAIGSRLVQLANRPGIRRLIIVTVGLAFFVIGSAYLNLARPQDMVVVKIVGGDAVRAGLPATFRVVSSWADRRASATVEVGLSRSSSMRSLGLSTLSRSLHPPSGMSSIGRSKSATQRCVFRKVIMVGIEVLVFGRGWSPAPNEAGAGRAPLRIRSGG